MCNQLFLPYLSTNENYPHKILVTSYFCLTSPSTKITYTKCVLPVISPYLSTNENYPYKICVTSYFCPTSPPMKITHTKHV
jgi:hypothetical protein